MKSLSGVRVFATPWTVARQAPPSMGFSRQDYWSGLLFPSPGDLPNPGIEPQVSHIAGRRFHLWATREVPFMHKGWVNGSSILIAPEIRSQQREQAFHLEWFGFLLERGIWSWLSSSFPTLMVFVVLLLYSIDIYIFWLSLNTERSKVPFSILRSLWKDRRPKIHCGSQAWYIWHKWMLPHVYQFYKSHDG